MKVYGKLAKARLLLQKSNLKKTGKGHGFIYFELADYLPRTTEIFAELGLVSFTKITDTNAMMTIVDAEDGSAIEFEIPFANFKGAEKKGLQQIQELGGTITYLSRYLWTQVMSIVEPDTIDGAKKDKQDTWGDKPATRIPRPATLTPVNPPVVQATPAPAKTHTDEIKWWDGVSPLEVFDHFQIDTEEGLLTYKTMKNKTKGNLFGLCIDENVSYERKYFDIE